MALAKLKLGSKSISFDTKLAWKNMLVDADIVKSSTSLENVLRRIRNWAADLKSGKPLNLNRRPAIVTKVELHREGGLAHQLAEVNRLD